MSDRDRQNDRQRKRNGSEQCAGDVWRDLSDDKGLPMQVLNPEKLAERANDHEQENTNGNLSKPQFRWSSHMVQTSDRRTKTIPSAATFHARERTRKTPAAYKP